MVQVKALLTRVAKSVINKNDTFVIIVDECDDSSGNGAWVNILYNKDCRLKSFFLDSIYITFSIDEQALKTFILQNIQKYVLYLQSVVKQKINLINITYKEHDKGRYRKRDCEKHRC